MVFFCGIMSVCSADVNMQKQIFFTLIGSSSSGTDALPNGLDVTFEVTEIKRLTGSYNTMVGNNEGSMVRETTLTYSSCLSYFPLYYGLGMEHECIR